MSRFYSTSVTPERKTVAKKGARKNLTTHIRGWNMGVEVEAYVNGEGLDCFAVYRTSGSNGHDRKILKLLIDPNSAGPRNLKGQLK